jgi:hypothetical protein
MLKRIYARPRTRYGERPGEGSAHAKKNPSPGSLASAGSPPSPARGEGQFTFMRISASNPVS